MAKKLVYIYQSFERFWHWMQSVLIFFLAFTGFEIHGFYDFFGFREAVIYHNIAAYMFIGLIVFAIFWHATTGQWKQYVPTFKNIRAQLEYYLFGIFKNAPHPTKRTVLSKLNPLQKITYFALKILVIPMSVTSGLLYMFYRYPTKHGMETININSLEYVAIFHTVAALLLILFLVMHLYLITTGETVTSNLKAMLTGYEEIEIDDEEAENFDSTENTKEYLLTAELNSSQPTILNADINDMISVNDDIELSEKVITTHDHSAETATDNEQAELKESEAIDENNNNREIN